MRFATFVTSAFVLQGVLKPNWYSVETLLIFTSCVDDFKTKSFETTNFHYHYICTTCDAINDCILLLLFSNQVYIMLAKPEKNVRSAFTTSTVVRMHVGNAKKAAKTGKSSSSMANLFRRSGSTQDNVRYGKIEDYMKYG